MKRFYPSLYAFAIALFFIAATYGIKHEITFSESIVYVLLSLFLPRTLLVIVALLTLCNLLFFHYFQREWQSSDIYNFMTHMPETFETFFAFWQMFWIPILSFSVIILLIVKKKKAPLLYGKKGAFFALVFGFFALPQLRILPELILHESSPNSFCTQETPLYPRNEGMQNIILIIGESMKYNTYVEEKLKNLHLFYKKIYAGATNTDVSLPLLINAKNNPLHLTGDNQTNLFRLARKNGYHTAFVSLQTPAALQYINPYLQTGMIEQYQSFDKKERSPKYDFYLLDALKEANLSRKNFIVLQQIGQHSPYRYFPGKKSASAKQNYQKSLDYSFQLYAKIINYLKKSQKPFILLYTSDHGEFTGENGRWGHNSFAPTIYEVPFFATANSKLPKETKKIASHYHLSQFITSLLGYYDKTTFSKEKHIVNGTMITREDGYREIENNSSAE